MATTDLFDQDLEPMVPDLRPDRDSSIISVRPKGPEPEVQAPLAQLEDEVTVAVEAVREELRALVEKLDPVLTPRVDEEGKPAAPPQGPRSRMAGSLATWRDDLLVLSNEVREVTGRIEL